MMARIFAEIRAAISIIGKDVSHIIGRSEDPETRNLRGV